MIPARRKIDRPRGFRQAQGKQTGPEIGLAKIEIGPGVTDRPRDRPRIEIGPGDSDRPRGNRQAKR